MEANTAKKITGFKKSKVYQLFNSLKRKGFLREIIKGKYTASSDAFSFASQLIWPSYVSFWSALSHYKFTEQLPRTVFLATTKKRREISFDGQKISYVKILPKRFFGYRKLEGVMIAEKEKALIDSLLFPRYAGGIPEVFKCMREGWPSLDKTRLVSYAMRIGNVSLLRRLGFLIERGELDLSEELAKTILKKSGNTGGFSKLDPSSSESTGKKYDMRWRIIVNYDEKKIFEGGVQV